MCCFEGLHEGHKIVKVTDAEKGIQLDQKDVFSELKTVTETATEMNKKLGKKIAKIEENTKDVIKKIDYVEAALYEEIKHNMDKIRKTMETEASETKESIRLRMEKLDELIDSSNALMKCVESNDSGEGPYASMWNISEMAKTIRQLTAIETERLESVNFNYLVSVDEEKDKLKSLIEKFIVSKKTISIQPKYPIDFEKLTQLKSVQSTISTGGSTANYGSVYDQRRRVIISVTGTQNEKTNLKLTRLTGKGTDLKSIMKDIQEVVPFSSANVRPIYDGSRYIYFVGTKSDSKNNFGRINIEKIESKTFEELPSLPDRAKDSKRSFSFPSAGVYHFGNVYLIDSDYKLWRFTVSVTRNFKISLFFVFCFSFCSSFFRTTNGQNSKFKFLVMQTS